MNGSAQLLGSAGRWAIAGAIVYLGWQLGEVSRHLPLLAQTADRVAAEIPATRSEVGLVREEAARIRALVPATLDEVAAVRGTLPPVLAELARMRQSLPDILARIDAIEAQVAPVLARVDDTVAVLNRSNDQLPQALATADRAVTTIDRVRADLVGVAPRALEEVRLTREAVDPTLDRVQHLVDDAYVKATNAIDSAADAGQGASEGALTGLVTGTFKLPFKLIGTLVSPLLGEMPVRVASRLTEEDLALIAEAGDRLRESPTPGRTERWHNPANDNGGEITLLRRYRLHDRDCIEVRVRITTGAEELVDRPGNYCRADDQQWVRADRIPAP